MSEFMQKLLFWLKNWELYFLVSLLVFIPLFPKFPFIRVPGTYVSVRLEDFLIGIISLVFLRNYWWKIKFIVQRKISTKIFLFILIGGISFVSGVLVTHTVSFHIGFLHWLRRIEYFLPLFLGFLYFSKKPGGDLDIFFKVLVLDIVLLFLYGFGQKHFNWPVIITQNEEYAKGIALRWVAGSHINSSFAGHYDLASFLVFVMPFIITAFFITKSLKIRTVLSLSIFSGLWLLTNAISRISLISYLFAITLSLLLIKKYRAILLISFISLIFFFSSSGVWVRYSQIIEVTWQKIKSRISLTTPAVYAAGSGLPVRQANTNEEKGGVEVFEDRSTSIRLNVEWPRAIRAFSKNPLLGTGFSSITLATDNDFLRLMGEVGTLGFISFCLILGEIISHFKKIIALFSRVNNREKIFFAGFIGGFGGLMTNAFFIDIFEASKIAIIFWLTTGIFLAMAEKLYAQKN